ncbi:MAG: sigma-54-dependent transcriptional regulator [Myxococcota bacterium]
MGAPSGQQTRTVLAIDDEPLMLDMLTDLLKGHGVRVVAVEGAACALEAVADEGFDAILSDIRMPGADGLSLLPQLRLRAPDTPVILMTGYASIDTAVAALRAGAFDYLTKPFRSDEVVACLERAFRVRTLEVENQRLRRAVDRSTSFGDLIGRSPAMREIFALVRRISSSRSNVLICGESGTGKEVVARTIHFTGSRARRSFVPINCTAMPEGLLESELFGHVRGAFTGAHTAKQGLFEEADGGTLFLDEIGDMPSSLQGKLLRVLQDREIRPVGGNRAVKVDVRIISATHQDLEQSVAEGRFRADLYYRLNVIPIRIPPLRERPEDVPLLAEAFLRRHARADGPVLSAAAIRHLEHQSWEGNARELENAIERALVMCDGREILPRHLSLMQTGGERSASPDSSLLEDAWRKRMTVRELTDRYIATVLEHTGGRKTDAARILGLNRRTLYRRQVHERREEASTG